MKTDLLFKKIETKEHIDKINIVIDYVLDMLRGIENNSEEKIKKLISDRKEFYGCLGLTLEQTVGALRSHLFNMFHMQKEYALTQKNSKHKAK